VPEMRMMKTFGSVTAAVLITASILGCATPRRTDTSGLAITPGVGISNLLTVGMTRSQTKKASPDTVIMYRPDDRKRCEEPKSWAFYIPALGASHTGLFSMADPVGNITFRVSANTNATETIFRGSLSCGISFGAGRRVTREDVIKKFGEPQEHLDAVQGDGSSKAASYFGSKTSYALICQNGEMLYYGASGIQFSLRDNAVELVSVFPSATREAMEPAPQR